jgi:hypothetical protein
MELVRRTRPVPEAEPGTPYTVAPARPWLQLGLRAGLWAAIGIGFLGGVVGLVRPAGTAAEAEAPPADETVPATVANFAELAVETWMTAGEDDADRLDEYFAQLPVSEGLETGERTIGRVRAIGGRRVQEGYWRVTVAAEVTEPPTGPTPTVWHLQIGILGTDRGGMVAVDAPALMPPVAPAGGMGIAVDGLVRPAEGDPLADAVEGFLRALLAGQGDLDRYLVRENRAGVAPLDPAPFVEVDLELIAVEELDGSARRVRVEVLATTAGGTEKRLRYELEMEPGDGQWLVRDAGGAPTLTETATGDVPPTTASGDHVDHPTSSTRPTTTNPGDPTQPTQSTTTDPTETTTCPTSSTCGPSSSSSDAAP